MGQNGITYCIYYSHQYRYCNFNLKPNYGRGFCSLFIFAYTFGDMISKDQIESLNKSLKLYDVIYFTFLTIILLVALFLIAQKIIFNHIYNK